MGLKIDSAMQAVFGAVKRNQKDTSTGKELRI
jgi:hypothetical protein